MKTLGIIGFGRFGQLAAEHLMKYFKVSVSDIRDKSKEAKAIGVELTNIEDCSNKDIVLLCVPISAMEATLKQISPFLKNGSLVLDTCSVKEIPVRLMKKIIPKECDCIGTHPLFGPDTAKKGLKGLKIVLCPIRINKQRLNETKIFLKKLGLTTITTSPSRHDKEMAKSLLLIHFLGKALSKIGADKVKLATQTHKGLMEIINIANKDTEELFIDMNKYNRFSSKIRKELIGALTGLDHRLKVI